MYTLLLTAFLTSVTFARERGVTKMCASKNVEFESLNFIFFLGQIKQQITARQSSISGVGEFSCVNCLQNVKNVRVHVCKKTQTVSASSAHRRPAFGTRVICWDLITYKMLLSELVQNLGLRKPQHSLTRHVHVTKALLQ